MEFYSSVKNRIMSSLGKGETEDHRVKRNKLDLESKIPHLLTLYISTVYLSITYLSIHPATYLSDMTVQKGDYVGG